MRSKSLVFILLVGICYTSISQEKAIPGLDRFTKYDRTYATPELRKQPGIAVGYTMGLHVPFSGHFDDGFKPNNGFYLSYYQMYGRRGGLKRREGVQVFRERFQFGFGGALDIGFGHDGGIFGSLSAYFFRPIIRLNLGVVAFSFINEFGIGLGWRPESYAANGKTVAPVITFEPFRVQLFTLPIFITASAVYSTRNDVFGKSPLNVTALFGAKIYFYNYAKRKK